MGGFVLKWNVPDAHLAADDNGSWIFYMFVWKSHAYSVCGNTRGYVDSRRLVREEFGNVSKVHYALKI